MNLNTLLVGGLLIILSSCNAQGQKSATRNVETAPLLLGDTVTRIDGEIRGIVQDSKNNIWFASNGDGVYRYDGQIIVNFSEKHGLSSNYVWMVMEDEAGNIYLTDASANYGGPVDPTTSVRGSVWKLVPADKVPAGAVTAPLQKK